MIGTLPYCTADSRRRRGRRRRRDRCWNYRDRCTILHIHAMLMIVCGSIGSICTCSTSEREPTGCQVANSEVRKHLRSGNHIDVHKYFVLATANGLTSLSLRSHRQSSFVATYSYICGSRIVQTST